MQHMHLILKLRAPVGSALKIKREEFGIIGKVGQSKMDCDGWIRLGDQ